MITNIDINLLDWFDKSKTNVALCQQNNCFHIWGGGIALQMKNRYPGAYKEDIHFGERGDINKLGQFYNHYLSTDPLKIIYGIFGQFDIGYGERKTNYEAIYSGMEGVKYHALKNGIIDLGIPYNIGCRLGGGNWRIVSTMIEELFKDSELNLYICRYEP